MAAEGTINTSMTQVQPGFQSRTWADRNSTADATTVTLSACRVNRGGGAAGSVALRSVGLAMFQDEVIVGNIVKACGVYNFGRTPAGNYYFRITEVLSGSRMEPVTRLAPSSVER